jgi:K+-transporting ATPase A subunit
MSMTANKNFKGYSGKLSVSLHNTPVIHPMAPLAFLSSSTGMGIHSIPKDL